MAVRTLVAWYPDWPVVAARAAGRGGGAAGEPAAVVAAGRVVAASDSARAEGVVPGLRRREAQARCPALEVMPADPGHETRAWEPVVAAVAAFSPLVDVLAPGAVALATRGPSRYFGGDAALAARVAAAVDEVVGPAGEPGGCGVGVADGLFAARVAAQRGAGCRAGRQESGCRAGRQESREALVVPVGETPGWLAPQPIGVLVPGRAAAVHDAVPGDPVADLVDLLVRLGIRTLGAFAELPAASVLGRFGAVGAAAHRLASGGDDTPLSATTPPPDLAVVAELDPPAERVDTAAFVAKALADELQDGLGALGLACSRLVIEAETEHGERLVRRWRHEGVLTARAVAERVRWQLDAWLTDRETGAGPVARETLPPALGGFPAGPLGPCHLPSVGGPFPMAPPAAHQSPAGGLTLLRLIPEEVHPDVGRQLGLWGGAAAGDARAARGFARVQGLLGPGAVTTAVLGGGRSPADQVRLVPWGDPRFPARPWSPWPGRVCGPAPAVVHESRPEADVRDITGNEVLVSARGAASATPATLSVAGGPGERVVAWAGPWPVEERWWDAAGRRLARLQLAVESGAAYLLVREHGRWWLEASYD